jgi:hypothetical protein
MRVDKYTVRRLIASIPLVIALLGACWWGVNEVRKQPTFSCDTHVVDITSGDTLYNISHRHCSGDIQEVISRLVSIYGTQLDTWQTIHLPVASPRP